MNSTGERDGRAQVLNRIWTDPVWSKVIAAGIIWVLSSFLVLKSVLPSAVVFALWVGCVAIRYWKTASGRLIQPSASVRLFKFGPKARRAALAGMFVLPIALLSVDYHAYVLQRQTLILIAPLDGPDPKTYRVSETIEAELQHVAARYRDVAVRVLDSSITVADSDTARSIGTKQGATLVVWGWYTRTNEQTRATLHVEVLRMADLVFLSRAQETIALDRKALESFEIQTRLSTDVAYVSLLLTGLVRYQKNDLTGALDRLSEAIGQPSVPEQLTTPGIAYLYRSNIYLILNKPDKAIQDSNRLLELVPEFIGGYSIRGAAYVAMGKFDKAIDDLNKAIAIAPSFPSLYFNRGVAYKKQGCLALAVADYDKFLQLEPGSAEGYTNRGNARLQMGQVDQAIKDFTTAITLDRKLAMAYNNRASAYLDRDNEQALRDIKKAIALDPKMAGVYVNRAHVYADAGQVNKAFEDLNYATKLQPELAAAYENRGILYVQQHQFDLALTELNSAIEREPSAIASYNARGLAYSGKHQDKLALENYGRALGLNGNYADAYLNRGWSYVALGEMHKAESDFATVLVLSEDAALQKKARAGLSEIDVPGCMGSGHEEGEAFDISEVYGRRVSDYGADPQVRGLVERLQTDMVKDREKWDVDENYGPAGLFKRGKRFVDPNLERNHLNHVHVRVRARTSGIKQSSICTRLNQ